MSSLWAMAVECAMLISSAALLMFGSSLSNIPSTSNWSKTQSMFLTLVPLSLILQVVCIQANQMKS